MTGRERVKSALTFNSPDRAPRDLWILPYVGLFQKDEFEALVARYPLDIQSCPLSDQAEDLSSVPFAKVGQYTDEWGSVWHVAEAGIIGEVKEPALPDWSKLDTFQPPWQEVRNRDFSYANQFCEETDKFVLSNVAARPFERLQFLRGTENLYIDIGYGTSEFRKLLEMVHEFHLEDVKSWCESGVDGVFFMDDWGANHSLLIDPKTWHEVFAPLYKDYCDIIHAAGKHAFFHSDGNIESIYPGLIKVGIDAVNSQLFVMDIEKLAREYKGKITFWGEIDRQHVLPFGGPDDVREAVMRVRSALDDGSGGVIAECEWGKGNPTQNIEAVFDGWSEPME